MHKKVQVFVSFDATLYKQLVCVWADYAKCTARSYISIALYKNLYFCDCA